MSIELGIEWIILILILFSFALILVYDTTKIINYDIEKKLDEYNKLKKENEILKETINIIEE